MRPALPLTLGVFLLSPLAACSFERGDRYWSGKPQPIGIDFSASHVTAIYANGTENFTTLAIVGHLPGNEYGEYMYAKFATIKDWGNDDLMITDLYDDDPSESPLEHALTIGSKWMKDLGSWSCEKLSPLLDSRPSYHRICFPDYTYSPQRPKSKYRYLLSQSRMNRLRNITPKWFRSPTPTGMTKAKLIIDILEYLERIKEISLAERGVKITSAIISRPSWAYNEYDDLFDEACLLAGIEVLEQPSDRVSIATKVLSEDVGRVMVLDHGHYYLSIHRSTWDERDEQYHQRGSMQLDEYGTVWILRKLANRIIWGYNRNVTEEERGWPGRVKNQNVVMQAMGARLQIKFRRDWPEDLEFENRTVAVNLTDDTGFVRVLNMTGADVERVEREYVEEIRRGIEQSVWKHMEIYEYIRSLPNYDELKDLPFPEYRSIEANIVENVAAPEHIGSWIEHIEKFIILDTGTEAGLLYEAANMALGRSAVPEERDSGTCVPTIETAARGAALRAREWIGYWEGYEKEKLYWERFDEDDPDTWENEEDEWEEDDEQGGREDEL